MTDREEVFTKALRELVEASTLGVKMLDICGESKEADNLSGAISTAEKVLSEPSRTREEILEDAKNYTAYYEKVMESLAELRESFALCEKQWREESYNSGLAAGRAERAVEPNKTEGWEERFDKEFPYGAYRRDQSLVDMGEECPHYSCTERLKSFISAEIAKAREEGFQDGFEDGLAQGRKEGHDVGYRKGREAGR